MNPSLNALGAMVESVRALRTLVPSLVLPFEPAHVMLISRQRRACEALVQAIEAAAGRSLDAMHVRITLPKDAYPSLVRMKRAPDAVWFLHRHDRVEHGSSDFTAWCAEQQQVLRRIPLHTFVLYELGNLKSDIEVKPLTIAGRTVVTSPIALDGDAFDGGGERVRLQAAIAGKLLVAALRQAAAVYSLTDVAEEWDAETADALGRRRSRDSNAAATPARALAWLRELRQWRDDARGAVAAVARAFKEGATFDHRTADDLATEPLAWRLAVEINDLRYVAPDSGGDDYVPPRSFADDFQSLLRRALSRAKPLIADLESLGETDAARIFKEVREDIGNDVRVILLGAFSSGKSTLINALLRLSDKRLKLPATGEPETATINVVQYDRRNFMSVKFRDEVTSQFFTNAAPGKVKPSTQEIAAFLHWWGAKLIDRSRLRFERFLPSSAKQSEGKSRTCTRDDFAYLKWAMELPADYHLRVEDLQLRRTIGAVRGIHFYKHLDVPDPDDAQSSFAWLKRPENALRIAEATIHRDTPALEALRFVDTPGTDSAVSHHHWMARKYIEDYRSSPVLYLFDATVGAGTADDDNVAFLKKHQRDVARFFFVINKRGTRHRDNDAEVVDRVRRCLREAGLPVRRLYFVDAEAALTDPTDPEWVALEEGLRDFVNNDRTKWLRDEIRTRFRDALAGRVKRERDTMAGNQADGAKQTKIRAEWLEAANAVRAALKKLEVEAESLKESILRSSSGDLRNDIKSIIDQLDGFEAGARLTSTKHQKLSQLITKIDSLGDWPPKLEANLRAASKHLHALLRSELSAYTEKLGLNLSRVELPPDFVGLTLNDIREKAAEDVGRGGFWSLWSFTDAMKVKVATLQWMLKSASTTAARRTRAQIDVLVRKYRDQCEPAEKHARHEARATTPSDKNEKNKRSEALLAVLEKHLGAFNGILME